MAALLHQAPELFTGKHGLTNAGLSIDVYAFGMVRYLILQCNGGKR
jgi:hypothetical protein